MLKLGHLSLYYWTVRVLYIYVCVCVLYIYIYLRVLYIYVLYIYMYIYTHTQYTHKYTYKYTDIYKLYILYIHTHTYDTSPYQIYDLQIFSHILLSFHFLDSALFTFLTVSPNLRSSDIFNFEVQIYFLSFVACAPGDISKNPLPNPRSWRFTLMFPPNSFTLLCKNSSFKSLVHLELIFVCGAKWGPTSFFDFQFWGQGQWCSLCDIFTLGAECLVVRGSKPGSPGLSLQEQLGPHILCGTVSQAEPPSHKRGLG